jgi:hypothetical protein
MSLNPKVLIKSITETFKQKFANSQASVLDAFVQCRNK